MIRYYFKIAWRNLIKNKRYSMINIGGLAIGPWLLLAPLGIVIIVAGLSVLPESIKVALVKPANYLLNE